ncbi:signal peptidase I [Roseburia sp. MSJ-14]|uniref:signal peptidase I n=1 Tax=Roseburia sp. MSJ-14 TaxID=2841514 RepID=UPI001C0FCC42|nr:signal peptidase I [Roseburia sp. MSJ-14]MBU5471996.1 signal peptidase I [Roseburia sp. MSJ-14]
MRRRSGGLNFNRRKRKVNTALLKEIGIWTGEILAVMLIAVVLVLFIGFRIKVVGASMSPTLESGEEILVNRFRYKIFSPKQNDLIVFLPNGNEKSHYYIKRVIACPGDKVQIKDGVVYVNGKKFDEKVAVANIENPLLAENEITVGEDEYFVLGDNRNNSEDSRYASIGNVKKEYIVGKAWFVVSPWGKFGFIK